MRSLLFQCRAPVALAALCVCACACNNDLPDRGAPKPIAPTMQSVLDAYAAPTAVLAKDSVGALALAITRRIAAVDALQLDARVIQAAQAAVMQLQMNAAAAAAQPLTQSRGPVAVSEQALTVEGDGFLVVTRICDGWGPLPVPDLANGVIELIVGFDEATVDPVIWGSLSSCRYALAGHAVQIDGIEPDPARGDVRIFIGPGVTLATFGTFPNPLVVDLTAQVLVDGAALEGSFNFRVDVLSRALEMAVPLAGGHVIVAAAPERSSAVQVRALNGVFVCDAVSVRCTTPTGETIGAP